MNKKKVDLIVEAIADLETATTSEIIGQIKRRKLQPPTSRAVSQICCCIPIVIKVGMTEGYTIWGKGKDFDKVFNSRQQ